MQGSSEEFRWVIKVVLIDPPTSAGNLCFLKYAHNRGILGVFFFFFFFKIWASMICRTYVRVGQLKKQPQHLFYAKINYPPIYL